MLRTIRKIISEISPEFIESNFGGLFNSHSTAYGKFICCRCIFSDFVGFEECEFGKPQSKDLSDQMAIFNYVTFEKFTNFRSAEFHLGLYLEKTNFKEYPNFLGIKIGADNTNRETFRILKHSFDKIGNHIEANKFFAREMAEYKRELSGKGITQERFVFWFNSFFSNFGQSYLRPIFGIVDFAFIYYLLSIDYRL